MEKEVKTETPNKISKKPKWLKILEKQSWQAELVVSGLAIFGSLQLPSAINNWVDAAIYLVPNQVMVIAKYFFMYLYMVATILILNFIFHFVVRALWIGMLGLVSVFPNGINPNFKTYSEDYNQKLQQEFPDINKFNSKLDQLGSIIFSISSLMVMIFLSFSIVVIGIGILAFLLQILFPALQFEFIFSILLFIILIPMSIQSIFHLKKLREKEWIKKYHFPFFKKSAKWFYNFFYEPINYIQLTLITNSGMIKSSAMIMVYFMLIGIIAGFSLVDSNLLLLDDERYDKYHNSLIAWSADQYESTLPDEKTIFAPIIQSYQIEEDELNLFIPRLRRESSAIDSICPNKWEKNDTLSEEENDNARLDNRMECHNNYYQILLNDSPIKDLKFYNYRHPNKNERGYLTHISTSNCKKGDNELVIILGYKNPNSNQPKKFRIPFRYHSE